MIRPRLPRRPRAWRWLRRSAPAGEPLAHARLFVLPTRFGLGWLLLIAVLVLLGINYQNSLAYALAFWLFAVGGVVILRTWRNLLGVTVRIQPLGEVFAGDTARLRVTLQAARPRVALQVRLDLSATGETLTTQDIGDITGGEAQLLLGVPVARRGRVTLPPLRIATRWPLGLVRVTAWIGDATTLLVYPRPLDGGAGRARSRVTGEEADFAGLRRYQPGDSPARLAWKQWSRTGTLQTKQYDMPSIQSLWLDFAACEGDSETRLSRLCARVLAHHAAGDAFGLRLPGVEVPIARGVSQRRRALVALALWPDTRERIA